MPLRPLVVCSFSCPSLPCLTAPLSRPCRLRLLGAAAARDCGEKGEGGGEGPRVAGRGGQCKGAGDWRGGGGGSYVWSHPAGKAARGPMSSRPDVFQYILQLCSIKSNFAQEIGFFLVRVYYFISRTYSATAPVLFCHRLDLGVSCPGGPPGDGVTLPA